MRKLAFLTIAIPALFLGCNAAWSACGDRGGPGYRSKSSHRCIGWEALARECGNPPTTYCTPELVADRAGDAAKDGEEIRGFMMKQHEESNRPKEAPPSTRNP